MIQPKLFDIQCGFCPGRSTSQQLFDKSWEFAKDVYTCFVDLKRAYDRVLREKLWGALREYGVDGRPSSHSILAQMVVSEPSPESLQ